MARPRQGDGLKRTIRQRGDKFYAYEVTSVMENGTKKTVSKYLGRVDPETGELLDKIPGKSSADRKKIAEQRDIEVLKEIRVADFGATYLLDKVQRRIGLGQDLIDSFGNAAVSMLSIAFALVQCDGVFDAVDGVLERTWTRDLYGLEGSFDSGTLSRMTKEIGIKAQGNMEKFFEYRIRRNEGIVAWDTTTHGCYSDMDGLAEYVVNNKDDEDLKQVKIGLATNKRGVPMLYRIYPGNVSDMDTVKNLSNDIGRCGGKDALYVMDRGFCSGWNLRFMLRNGYDFVVPAKTDGKAVKKLLTAFRTAKEAQDLEFGGHIYRVWKTELGIAADPGRKKVDGDQAYTFTIPEDEDHATEGKLTAYVCFDSKKYSDEVQAHKTMINDLMKAADKIDSKNPVAEFRKLAGKAVKHFDVEADGRKVKVTVRPKSASFEENRAGLFVMLTSEGVGWEAMMTAYDARRLTEQGFDRKKGESRRFYTSDKDAMRGREFLRFLDLILICELSAELREADLGRTVTVEGAISSLDCVQVREYHGTRYVTEIDRRQRKLFEAFGVPIPKEAVSGELIFDPQMES